MSAQLEVQKLEKLISNLADEIEVMTIMCCYPQSEDINADRDEVLANIRHHGNRVLKSLSKKYHYAGEKE